MHAVRDLSGGTLLTIITKFAVLLDSTEIVSYRCSCVSMNSVVS